MTESEMEVGLKHARGSIKTAEVALYHGDDLRGWDFRAWIDLAGKTVEFLQGASTTGDVETWYPFEDHDTYRNAGRVYSRAPINSFADWEKFVKEYAADLDPRDVFRYRRAEGL